MNKMLLKIQKQVSFLFLFLFATTSFAQEFIVTLGNAMMTTQELEVDLLLTVPAPGVRLHSVTTGINFNADILNGGTPSTALSNTGNASWVLIPGTIAPEIMANGGLNTIVTSFRGSQFPHLRVVQPTVASLYADLLPGTYRVGRFRFTNTVPWATGSDPEFWLSPTTLDPIPGSTNTVVGSSYYGTSSTPTNATTTSLGMYVTLGYTQGHPYRRSTFNSPELGIVSNQVDASIAIASPNPFQNSFKIKVNSNVSQALEIKVFDMLGKQIEAINAPISAMESLEIGENYPSGFYIVKVSQGDKAESIRMIKE